MTRRTLSTSLLLTSLAISAPAFGGTHEGNCLEDFTLRNFQTRSATFDQMVQSTSYRGKVVVLMLLSSG